MKKLVPYDAGTETFELLPHEVDFMDAFKNTHSINKALGALSVHYRKITKEDISKGNTQVSKAYKNFIENAPVHPQANKVVLLDNLVWAMEQSKADQDTAGVIRAINEINKMVKGNLTANAENKILKQTLIGVIDLSAKDEEDTVDVPTIEVK